MASPHVTSLFQIGLIENLTDVLELMGKRTRHELGDVTHHDVHGPCTSNEAAHWATKRTVLVVLINGRYVLYQVDEASLLLTRPALTTLPQRFCASERMSVSTMHHSVAIRKHATY